MGQIMSIPFTFSSTSNELERQRQELAELVAKNEKSLEELNAAVMLVAHLTEQTKQANRQVEEYLSKEPLKSPQELQLELEHTQDPLQPMSELHKVADKVNTKIAQQQIALESLNKEVEKTNALSDLIEEKIATLEGLIPQVQAILAARKKSIADTKNLIQEPKE